MGFWNFWKPKPKPVIVPRVRDIAIVLPFADAEVMFDLKGPVMTNADGIALFHGVGMFTSPRELHIKKDGYQRLDEMTPFLPGEDLQIRVGVDLDPSRPQDVWMPGLQSIAPPKPTRPFPPETQAIRAVGRFFRRADNSVFDLRGYSYFMGHARMHRGEDIRPSLDQMVAWGINEVTVFGRINWGRVSWGEDWTFYKDVRDPESWRRFYRLLAEYGITCEHTVLTDHDLPEHEQQIRVQESIDVAVEFPLVHERVGNEPHVNGIDTRAAMNGVTRRGVMMTSGEYRFVGTKWENGKPTDPPIPEIGDGFMPSPPITHIPYQLQYGDLHSERKLSDPVTPDDHYPRNGKEAQEFMGLTDMPWLDGEPCGIGERTKTGSGQRTADLTSILSHHAIARILVPGQRIHCEAGLQGRVPYKDTEPVQAHICEMIAKLWQFIPAEAPLGMYTRPGLNGWPTSWPKGDQTSFSKHAYGSICGDKVYLCVPRPQVKIEPIDGWREAAVFEDTSNYIARLER